MRRLRIMMMVLVGVLAALAGAAAPGWYSALVWPTEPEMVRFSRGEVELHGALLLPDGAGPHPAVVLVHGSGPMAHNDVLFKRMSRVFFKRGFAVLTYDKRGSGASGGEHDASTIMDFAGDVVSGVEFLRNRSEIAADKIGLWGHSQGGRTAPVAAMLLDPSVRFVVSSAGATVPWDRMIEHQQQLRLRKAGHPEEVVAEAVALHRRALDYYSRAANDPLQVDEVERQAIVDGWKHERFADLGWNFIPGTYDSARYARWSREMYHYDPMPALLELDSVGVALLLIFAQEDEQVPTQESVDVLERLRADGRLQHATIHVVQGVGHTFVRSLWRASFASEYLGLIGDWTEEQVRDDAAGNLIHPSDNRRATSGSDGA